MQPALLASYVHSLSEGFSSAACTLLKRGIFLFFIYYRSDRKQPLKPETHDTITRILKKKSSQFWKLYMKGWNSHDHIENYILI